jgi:uncharacterized phage-associated protein
MLTAQDIAEYFLSRVDPDSGDLISNLKIQKLVYYAQGYHLALNGTPLFREEIEAWEHGPVVPVLYRRYKQHGAGPIPIPESIDIEKYSEDVRELLEELYQVYSQFSAWKLRDMTHAEPPWVDAYSRCPSSVISHSAMQEYFKTQLVDA